MSGKPHVEDSAQELEIVGCYTARLLDPLAHQQSPVAESGLRPEDLVKELDFNLPRLGKGRDGVVGILQPLFKHSVNTWHQGFMGKLYASTTAVGLTSELVLASLNTNTHVFNGSPVLTVIEKTVGRELAQLFGFDGPNAGGIAQNGGSGANLTALVIGRNTVCPDTKRHGNGNRRLVLFTSAHGHYSFEKAAQICGLGSEAAWAVQVDDRGCMDAEDLCLQIQKARTAGFTPFFVNATAGTTVLGSYDPIEAIAAVCKQEHLWLHVDASWGGGAIFADSHKWKLQGSNLADSITINPHKMMNVPITCSFLLARDLKPFWQSNTLPAGYLFHSDSEHADTKADDEVMPEIWDLADLTLQCGRKGDALKVALSWIYFGAQGYSDMIENAFSVAAELAALVASRPDMSLVSSNPPPCLQVCFYYVPPGEDVRDEAANTRRTKKIWNALIPHNFLIDYAPGRHGSMLRAVVSLNTQRSTVRRLVDTIAELGQAIDKP